jgi:hypothetical protein
MKTTFVCAPFCLRAPPPSAKVLDPVAGMHAAPLERLHSVPLWTCRRISPTSQRAISGTGRLWSGHATKWFHLSSRTSSDTTPVLCEQLQAISFDTYRPPPREMLVWSVMSYAMPGTSGKTLPAPASPGSQQTGLLTPPRPVRYVSTTRSPLHYRHHRECPAVQRDSSHRCILNRSPRVFSHAALYLP